MAKIADKDATALAIRIVRKVREKDLNAKLKAYVDASWDLYKFAMPTSLLVAYKAYPEAFHGILHYNVRHKGEMLSLLFVPDPWGSSYIPTGWPRSGFGFPPGPDLHGFRPQFMEPDLDKVAARRDVVLEAVEAVNAEQTALAGTILGFGSWKRLAEGWPEISAEIPAEKLAAATSKTYLPVDTSALTKALGLPFPKED